LIGSTLLDRRISSRAALSRPVREIAKLAQKGIASANATAKALNEQGVKTARGGKWAARSVIAIRQRLESLTP
jgi:Recombinase